MKLTGLARAAGLLMIASGLALGFSYISHPAKMPPEVIASTSWFVIHLLFAISLLLGLLATTALYAMTALRTGRLGVIAYVLLFAGMLLIFGLDYYEVFIAPFLAINYPAVIVDHGAGDQMGPVAIAFPLAGLLTVVGYSLLALAWRRASVLPGPLAYGLIASAIAFGVGLSPLGGLLVARITATLFGAALVAVGFYAWRHERHFAVASGT